jgi:hypothetical protein
VHSRRCILARPVADFLKIVYDFPKLGRVRCKPLLHF